MGKKDRDLMATQREKFIGGCAERDIPAAKAERVWELMEKFAGYGFNKSHAAAYGVVAYQTAYLKANYPVEFMAALLTSEMGDTDKIVKYIDECRAMDIQVQPPDVNRSGVRFTVAGGTIRFGLAAIKNVGEAAMESILKTRATHGPFASLDDFCGRVDLRLVNRRVIESLIKAGAFDSLQLPRAHLMVQIDAALEGGQRQQRERAEGQASFFDLLPAVPVTPRADSVVLMPEWDDDQRLTFEKDVLGFYVSGHPLARYRSQAEALDVTSTGALAARSAGSAVRLFGHVLDLKETTTKRGNQMAFLTLEDMEGTVEVTVFPEPFKAGASRLRSREPLFIRGRVDDSDKGRVVLAEEVRSLDEVLREPRPPSPERETPPHACRLRVGREGGETTLPALARICAEHAGPVPLFVHVVLAEQEVVLRSRAFRVSASSACVAALEAILGPGRVIVDDAGSA
jgi:DNA polymerase-3 subunit alpha